MDICGVPIYILLSLVCVNFVQHVSYVCATNLLFCEIGQKLSGILAES